MVRTTVRAIILFASLIVAIKWYRDPAGAYEPVLVLLGLTEALFEFLFWRNAKKEVPATPEPVLADVSNTTQKAQQSTTSEPALPFFAWDSSSAFFLDRFNSTFPGVRKTSWFSGQEAVERLAALLRQPLVFKTSDHGYKSPIWWFGRGNLQIEHFRRLDAQTVLIDVDEYKISRIAAVYSSSYRRLWVYVETQPMPATGLYEKTPEYLARAIQENRCYAEEYGIYKGQHKISLAEYDDGHAMINGRIEDIRGQSEQRARYLTPYNFVICPHDSPINNNKFDRELKEMLDATLTDPDQFRILEDRISRLPITRA